MGSSQAKFNYYYLSPSSKNPEYKDIINRTYLFWKDIWLSSLNEIENIGQLYSDDFTRSDYFGVLYYGDEPLLMCLYKNHDITDILSTDDSYFQIWPKSIFQNLNQNKIKEVLVCSHYTLGRKYREVEGYKIKDLVLGMIHCVFQNSGHDILLATTRNLKKANQLMYSMGCEPLARDINYHGEPSDLVMLSRSNSIENLMNQTQPEIRNLVISLWENRNTLQKVKLKLVA